MQQDRQKNNFVVKQHSPFNPEVDTRWLPKHLRAGVVESELGRPLHDRLRSTEGSTEAQVVIGSVISIWLVSKSPWNSTVRETYLFSPTFFSRLPFLANRLLRKLMVEAVELAQAK